MESSPNGPGSPYQSLVEADTTPGLSLPPEFQSIYGGNWLIPPPTERPYVYTNFVVSYDGRTSFNEPGHEGGGDISRHVPHDTWLMGLLRARADAIITGATTLKHSPGHVWTAEHVFPADAAAFSALRVAEGRQPLPLLVLLTRTGAIDSDAAALAVPGQQVLIATTASGAAAARAVLGERPNLHYSVTAGDEIDMAALLRELRQRYGVASLLSEGGARLYGLLLREGLLDDAFTTLSPVVVGNPAPPAPPRTGLIEGVAFSPMQPPLVRLLALRRAEDYLFMRVRYG
ncbi:MAG: dihydrofolate reductase family protein [Chloroflexaceae bacterium]|jgi:riboflavin biosynthesis pyrimidine reductase|nr:dihydrofolate reductase family protein [Chloroflexaceae bacterium]